MFSPEPGEVTMSGAQERPSRERLAAELAALGPFFAVQVHEGSAVPAPPWQRFGGLLSNLDRRVQAVRGALAGNA